MRSLVADCCSIMGQPGGHFIPDAVVSPGVQHVVSATAGHARAASISTTATNFEMPVMSYADAISMLYAHAVTSVTMRASSITD